MRSTYRIPLLTEDRSSEAGSITVPLLLLTVVLVGAMVSTFGYAFLWRSKVQLQLRLDRCVESAARELVDIQSGIESSNLRMKAERAAALAAAIPTFGESLEAVKPVLAIEVAIAEALRVRWMLRQAKWIASRGCDGRGDLFFPLPGLKWQRPLPDTVGPKPLEWSSESTRLSIRLWKSNRFAGARIDRKSKGIRNEWNAKWAPRASLGE